ncbi:MAG: OmpA family protein [Bacteroidales bacterium]|jgi:outer membrane protein OmpA-like peptidoglycan-associated protein|nr:OmpA family protein [Bacteroidales bacterium]
MIKVRFYNKKLIFLVVLLSFASAVARAQHDDGDDDPCEQKMEKSVEREFKKARELQKAGKKTEAHDIYADILATYPDLLEVNYYCALIYYLPIEQNKFVITKPGDADKALEAFNRMYSICPYYKMQANLFAARLAYFMERFDEAVKFAKVLLDNPDLVKNMDNLDEAQVITEKSTFFGTVLKNPVPFEPHPVPGISTPDDEYLGILSPDEEEFYFTRRKTVNTGGYFGGDKEDREFFSMSKKGASGQFAEGMALPEPFNKGTTNEGSPTLNLTNDLLIFSKMTIASVNGYNYPNYDLYISQRIDDEWSMPANLGKNINRPDSWESQPSLSSDGKILFFASDRPGGYGGSDIWFAERNNDGTWHAPTNLGPAINTKGNERSPFLHTDSKTLYFSSSGHPGLGGLDIFYSKYDDAKGWGKAVNIGYPINSEKDEVDFFVSINGQMAYFSSNNLESKDWNIYQFNLYEAARPRDMILVKGEVQSDDGDLTDAIVEIRDTARKVLATTKVNENTGKYAIATEIDKTRLQDLIVNVRQAGHSFDTKLIEATQLQDGVITKNAEVKTVEVGKVYDLHDIHFATNSYTLTRQSIYIIEMFMEFLDANPTVRIEIQGHTDDIGDDNANLILSDNRAKAVYNYVITHGISANRLRYKGYGESAPVADNATPEGRAKNRRTVFLIYAK